MTASVRKRILEQNEGFTTRTYYEGKNFREERIYTISDGVLNIRAVGKTSWADSRFDDKSIANDEETHRFLYKYQSEMNLDGIANERNSTENRKKEIRQAISIAKQKTNKLEGEHLTIESDTYSYEDSDTTDANNDALVQAVSGLLIAASAYGIYKVTPYIKNWWHDKAVPSLKKMKNKVTGKAERIEEETDNDNLMEQSMPETNEEG